MTARRLHRLNAVALSAFLILHLANHASLIGGTDTHLAVQSVLAPLYRVLPIQTLLLLLFATQITLGLMLARRGKATGWRRAQRLSGLTLAAFLVVHVGAVLSTRWTGLETNVHFAASGVFHPVGKIFFALYYPAATLALAVHLTAHARLRGWIAPTPAIALSATGALFGALIVAGLMGTFGGPLPPAEYLWSGSNLPR